MTRYVVTFFKELIGANGHEAEVCQGALRIDALTALDAAAQGKLEFCDHGQFRDWSLRADRFSVEETEFRPPEKPALSSAPAPTS